MERPSTSAVPMALVPAAASSQGEPGIRAMREARWAKSRSPPQSSTRPRESDRITRPPCPCARAQLGHGGIGHAAQRLVALAGLAQLGLGQRFGGAQAAHVETQVGAAPPRTQDRLGDHAGHGALLVEQQARLRQRLPTVWMAMHVSLSGVLRHLLRGAVAKRDSAGRLCASALREARANRRTRPARCPAASPVGTRIA